MPRKKVVYTVGYGNRKLRDVLLLLKETKVDTIIDVRSRPYSRWNREWNKKYLEETFDRSRKYQYVWKGDVLGGDTHHMTMKKAIGQLIGELKSHSTVLLCAEKDSDNCHRWHKIGTKLVEQGLSVVNL